MIGLLAELDFECMGSAPRAGLALDAEEPAELTEEWDEVEESGECDLSEPLALPLPGGAVLTPLEVALWSLMVPSFESNEAAGEHWDCLVCCCSGCACCWREPLYWRPASRVS